MLLDDFISSQSSTAPIIDQIAQHFLPNSYGLAPQPPANNINTMQVGPPPVTRLVPDNLAAAARLPAMSSAARIEAIKSLLCSESDSEFGALSGDTSKLVGKHPSLPAAQSKPAPSRIPGAATAASFSAIPHPLPRMSSGAANFSTTTSALGDYRSPHPYHMPLMIKIPTKVRLPPQKDGKRINQHTYKDHAPGDGLLKIDIKSEMPASLVPVPLVSTERPYQSTIMTDHGILNIISSNEPGSKVPTPPASYISVNSNSTGTSSSSVAPSSLASTSPSDEHSQAAMAMTSLSLTQSTSSDGAKPKRSRSRAGRAGKKRTSFSRNHVYAMERRFDQQRYLTSVERKEFSNSIGLDDHHVKIWFQNRRSKLKRQAVVSSSSVTVRSTHDIRAEPHTGAIPPPPQHVNGHVLPSDATSSSVATAVSYAYYQSAVPAQLPSTHPTPATVYYQHMNSSIPSYTAATMMPPHGGTGVPYPTMNPTPSSVPSSYSSSIPTGVNAYAPMSQTVSAAPTPGSFAHPYAPQYSDANQNVLMPSATPHSHMPISAMKTQASAVHAASTVTGVPFQPVYGYVHEFGVDQGAAFAGQGSRSSSPFGNFPFSPGFNVPEDAGVNTFHNHMPILPPANMI